MNIRNVNQVIILCSTYVFAVGVPYGGAVLEENLKFKEIEDRRIMRWIQRGGEIWT